MVEATKDKLTDFITDNDLEGFFDYWKTVISPGSSHKRTGLLLRAEYTSLTDNAISGLLSPDVLALQNRQLVHRLLTLTDKLEAEDLRGGEADQPAEPVAEPDPLKELQLKKLAVLRRARVLETDASRKFKLDTEIQEILDQLKQ